MTLLELRNFQMSVKNKATGTPLGMYYIYSPYWLIAFSNELIGGTIYLHRRGASGVVLALYQRCTLKDDISYLLPT